MLISSNTSSVSITQQQSSFPIPDKQRAAALPLTADHVSDTPLVLWFHLTIRDFREILRLSPNSRATVNNSCLCPTPLQKRENEREKKILSYS